MLNAAIVGLGWWGRVLVSSVQGKSERIRFTRGVTLEPQAAEAFARQHALRVDTSLGEVLADPSIDTVVLATPHSQHVEQIVQVAAAGKAVFCEKPLAFSAVQARRALQACETAGVTFGLGHDKRWAPAVQALAELVADGRLGEVLHVEGQYSNDFSSQGLTGAWRESRVETPAGGLTGPGLHVLDAMLAIAGPAARVAGVLHEKEQGGVPADAVALLVQLQGGATGTLTSVRGVPDIFRLLVCGTRGWAEVTAMDELRIALKGHSPEQRRFGAFDSVRGALEAFAAAAQGGPAFPIPRTHMLRTACALEAALQAIATGRWIEVSPESP